MKIAIATQDLVRIDAHFGWARHLMVYEVSEEGWAFLETLTFPEGAAQDLAQSKLTARLDALAGCNFVFVAEVGPEGEFEMGRRGIVPIRRFAGQPVVTALEALRDGLRGAAPAWLRRVEQRYRRRDLES